MLSDLYWKIYIFLKSMSFEYFRVYLYLSSIVATNIFFRLHLQKNVTRIVGHLVVCVTKFGIVTVRYICSCKICFIISQRRLFRLFANAQWWWLLLHQRFYDNNIDLLFGSSRNDCQQFLVLFCICLLLPFELFRLLLLPSFSLNNFDITSTASKNS